MKIIMTQNGSTCMYASPETEIEKLMLQSLFSGPVEVRQHPTIQIGGKNWVDAVEIVPAVQKPTADKQPEQQ